MRVLHIQRSKILTGILLILAGIVIFLMIVIVTLTIKEYGLEREKKGTENTVIYSEQGTITEEPVAKSPAISGVNFSEDSYTDLILQLAIAISILSIIIATLLFYDDRYWRKLFRVADQKYEEKDRLINHIPAGMAILELNEGNLRPKFVNEGFYNMMQTTEIEWVECYGNDILNSIYEEDKKVLRGFIKAVTEGENLVHATVRLCLINKINYKWVEIIGKVYSRKKGTITICSSFHDMDEVQYNKKLMQSARTSLEIAIQNVDMILGEYYPDEKMMLYGNGREKWELAKYMENYPESWFALDITHPEDEKVLREAYRQVDAEEENVVCDVRNRKSLHSEQYSWYRMKFVSIMNENGERTKVICLYTNINEQKKAEAAYKKHLDAIIRLNPEALSTFRLNLTQNLCESGYSADPEIMQLFYESSINDFFRKAALMIPYPEEKQKFIKIFQKQHLMDEFLKGNSKIAMEHHVLLQSGRKDWINTSVEMLRNPETGDIEAVAYEVNINHKKMEEQIIHEILKYDYEIIYYVDCRTHSYYTFRNEDGKIISEGQKENFFDELEDYIKKNAADADSYELVKKLSPEIILEHLDEKEEFYLYFMLKQENGIIRKKKVQFSYMDRDNNKMIVLAQDIAVAEDDRERIIAAG